MFAREWPIRLARLYCRPRKHSKGGLLDSRGRDRLSQTAAVQNRDEAENDQHAGPYPAADVPSDEKIKDHHRKSAGYE